MPGCCSPSSIWSSASSSDWLRRVRRETARPRFLVLRHQVEVLQRKASRPKLSSVDRLFLAAASRILPKERWSSFVVTAANLLRWHRELVRRKWTYKAKGTGRPPIDPEVRELVVRMAKENRRWGYLRDPRRVPQARYPGGSEHDQRLLLREGLGPAPRRDGPTWSEFLWSQAIYVPHYNAERPHRGLKPAVPDKHPVRPGYEVPPRSGRDPFGGLIREYRAVAA